METGSNDNVLTIGSESFNLKKVLAMMPTLPTIEVRSDELSCPPNHNDVGPLLLYKRDGKYLVLKGEVAVASPSVNTVKGKLVSRVALKRAKLQ